MMTAPSPDLPYPAPQPWEIIFLSIGCAGVAFLGIGLWAALVLLGRGDAYDGVNLGGGWGTAAAFAILFVERGAHWGAFPLGVRRVCRGVAIACLIAACAGSLFAVALSLSEAGGHCLGFACVQPERDGVGIAVGLSLVAAVCQVGSVAWLTRVDRRS